MRVTILGEAEVLQRLFFFFFGNIPLNRGSYSYWTKSYFQNNQDSFNQSVLSQGENVIVQYSKLPM